MTKLEIACELRKNEMFLMNRPNTRLDFYVCILQENVQEISFEDGIVSYRSLWLTPIDVKELYQFYDKQMEYLANSGMDMTGWVIREIPAASSFMYYNPELRQAFDVITEHGEIYPAYMPDTFHIERAASIQDAINLYDPDMAGGHVSLNL